MVGTRRKLSGILATVVSAIAMDIAALLIAAPTAVAATYVLQNGAPVYLAGAAGSSQNFSLTVPSGAIDLSFNIYGGTGDADLYVKFGSAPTVASFDCRPFKTGNRSMVYEPFRHSAGNGCAPSILLAPSGTSSRRIRRRILRVADTAGSR